MICFHLFLNIDFNSWTIRGTWKYRLKIELLGRKGQNGGEAEQGSAVHGELLEDVRFIVALPP